MKKQVAAITVFVMVFFALYGWVHHSKHKEPITKRNADVLKSHRGLVFCKRVKDWT
jgi:hypothetical protein